MLQNVSSVRSTWLRAWAAWGVGGVGSRKHRARAAGSRGDAALGRSQPL